MELLKIGDFARLAGTNLRTLRYYEELGLMLPAARSAGGFRYYRKTDLNRLEMIRDLQELGLHLDRIRELMATRQGPDDGGGRGAGSGTGKDASQDERARFIERVRTALAEQERLLEERVRCLDEQRAKIRTALSKIRECEHCKHSPCEENNYCEPCALTGKSLPSTVSALF